MTQRITPPFWASYWGEDEHGAWISLVYKGIEHSFRWIHPGEFWMGSPENEKERLEDETRHRVRISKGFWMAETACTQALWQAVMGNNPSDFKGDDLPVDSVSWEDAQEFVEAINKLGEGRTLYFRLPTEAEWEYCCRAGSEKPFSFGETIDSEQVNFNGTNPYSNSKKSEYRRKTVAVHSLPCNKWGLYEMHGNLWEWCEDWYGEYEIGNELVVDPRGCNTGSFRVLRGGSWISVARDCRSARRDWLVPAGRHFGFRLVSGHQEKTE